MTRSFLVLHLAVLVGATFAAPGCRRDTDERLGLDEKKAFQVSDPTELAREGELEKMVSAPAAEVTARLGSYRFSQSARLAISAGERKDDFEESWKLEVDGKGGAHTLVENSHDYGFETIVSSNTVYVRPRYGHYSQHAPEGDEIERIRDGVQGVLGGYLAALGRFAARRDEGDTTTSGRKVRRIKLSLAASPARFKDPDPNHAWRKDMKVTALDGTVDVDVQSGAPMHATLDATWSAPQPPPAGSGSAAPSTEVTVKLAYRADIDQVGAVPVIAAPEGPLAPALRTRPLVDRATLLDGLVTMSTSTSNGNGNGGTGSNGNGAAKSGNGGSKAAPSDSAPAPRKAAPPEGGGGNAD